MNRTLAALGLAAVLALAALLLGRPTTHPPSTHPREPLAPFGGASPSPTQPRATDGAKATAGGVTLDARLSHPWVLPGTTEAFVTVTLQAAQDAARGQHPLHLALVIDRSASMAGARLREAKAAARALIDSLDPDDRLSLIHYGSEAESLPTQTADAEGKARLHAYVDQLEAEGATNLGEGLEAAERALTGDTDPDALRRVLLLSDGQPTAGEVESSPLLSRARRMRAAGLTLSTLGLGEDFNEDLLAGLADLGAGTYDYLDRGAVLSERLAQHLERAQHTVADALEVSFALPPGTELLEVYGHQTERHDGSFQVQLPGLAAGQSLSFVARLRLEAGTRASELEVAELGLHVFEAGSAPPSHARVRLIARVTDDAKRVADNRDRSTTLQISRALAAQHLEHAAEALNAMQGAAARDHLHDGRELLEALAAGEGPIPPPTSAELQQLRAEQSRREALVQAELASGGGSFGGSAAVKSLKVEARRGFGRMEATP